MAFIQVLPEYGLVVDPLVGLVTTAAESLQPVIDRVEEIEKVTDDLIGMLSGEGNFLASFPGREKSLSIAGMVAPFWYGLAVGLLIAGIVALQFL
ncbi:MAG TPA: tetrahydromethanopterin S-methyltransferase subunit B [Methanomicrobiales archaeon]|nr:tetrahydromethanopterin S-methyltransferase subunit B [Methanomicrobiales archaeon]